MEPVTLMHLQGLPARITLDPFPSGHAHASAIRLHGTVASLSAAQLTVDLVTPPPANLPVAPVRVEILHPDGLLAFTSQCRLQTGNDRLHLAAPRAEDLQWLQRRRHVRVAVRIACELRRCSDIDPARKWRGMIQNLSAGGVAVETRGEFAPGDRLFLHFPPNQNLHATPLLAEVVRVSPAESAQSLIALRFVGLTQHQEAAVSQFVESIDRQIRSRQAALNLPLEQN